MDSLHLCHNSLFWLEPICILHSASFPEIATVDFLHVETLLRNDAIALYKSLVQLLHFIEQDTCIFRYPPDLRYNGISRAMTQPLTYTRYDVSSIYLSLLAIPSFLIEPLTIHENLLHQEELAFFLIDFSNIHEIFWSKKKASPSARSSLMPPSSSFSAPNLAELSLPSSCPRGRFILSRPQVRYRPCQNQILDSSSRPLSTPSSVESSVSRILGLVKCSLRPSSWFSCLISAPKFLRSRWEKPSPLDRQDLREVQGIECQRILNLRMWLGNTYRSHRLLAGALQIPRGLVQAVPSLPPLRIDAVDSRSIDESL